MKGAGPGSLSVLECDRPELDATAPPAPPDARVPLPPCKPPLPNAPKPPNPPLERGVEDGRGTWRPWPDEAVPLRLCRSSGVWKDQLGGLAAAAPLPKGGTNG